MAADVDVFLADAGRRIRPAISLILTHLVIVSGVELTGVDCLSLDPTLVSWMLPCVITWIAAPMGT